MTKNRDVCSNCGSTKSSDFWDYADGTSLCNKCEKQHGSEWEKKYASSNSCPEIN